MWYYTEGLKLLYSKRPIFRVQSGKKLHRAENFYTDAVCGVCDKYQVWARYGVHETMKPWNQKSCQHIAVQRWSAWRDKLWNHKTMKPISILLSRDGVNKTMKPVSVHQFSAGRDNPWNYENITLRYCFPKCVMTCLKEAPLKFTQGHLGIALLAFAPPPHSNGHSGALFSGPIWATLSNHRFEGI